MNCDSVSKLIPLYYYGELTPEEEDQLDQHLHECSVCAAGMEKQRQLAAALDRRQVEMPPALLEGCRGDLMAAIAGGAPRTAGRHNGPWKLFLEAMGGTLSGFGRMWQPAGAVALIALAFFAGRFSGAIPDRSAGAVPSADVQSSVRAVKTGSDGRVQITVDETRRHEITGSLKDPDIRKYLEAGSRDEDPAVRVEAVGLMKQGADSPDMLDSLLNALVNDPNDAVRLGAMDAVGSMAGDPRVAQALSQVLMADTNPAMRVQAIQAISTHHDGAFVGMLQNLMQREENDGVRTKASKLLENWNASVGNF